MAENHCLTESGDVSGDYQFRGSDTTVYENSFDLSIGATGREIGTDRCQIVVSK